MKSLLCFIFLLGVLASCKKDNSNYVLKDPDSLDGATIAKSGNFIFSDERYNEGEAKIYIRKDGVTVFGLEQMNYQTSYSDTNIYLSATAELTTASVKIFSAKKLHGNIYHPLTSGINAVAFSYVIIQGDADNEPVASALLK